MSTHNAHNRHPLDIPEVLFQVALYLDAKGVIACSLVSRAFHSFFAPFVWGDIHLGPSPPNAHHHEPLARSITFGPAQSGPFQLDQFMQILQRITPWVCLHLESLELELIYVSLPPNTTESKVAPTVQFPKLKNLVLRKLFHATPLQQLNWLISLCPMLNTLEWVMPSTVLLPPIKEFTDYCAAGTWPELDLITIKGFSGYIEGKEYAALLRAAQRPLRVLDLQLDYLETDSFTLLRQDHFKTLTKVDLSRANNGSSNPSSLPGEAPEWVQEVLESCPSLKSIDAKIITAQDIMKGKPWVCLRLEEFNVMINMEFKGRTLERGPKRPKYTEDEEHQCRAVYEQLGRLTQLKSLDMFHYRGRSRAETTVSLPLELRMGLGQLCRLKNMEMANNITEVYDSDSDISELEDESPQMVFGSVISSPLCSLSPQKALELANLYLDNAYKASDSDIALILCHDTKVSLFQAKKATKQSKDPMAIEGIATAYMDLSKLLEKHGHESESRTICKKGEKLGLSSRLMTYWRQVYRTGCKPLRRTPTSRIGSRTVSSRDAELPRTRLWHRMVYGIWWRVLGTSIQGVLGLSSLNKQLLNQRGAVGEQEHLFSETGKKLSTMTSVVSTLKQSSVGTTADPSSLLEGPAEQSEQEQ
ncbi:MAG: hypothetical protein J3Q66DRAFT_366571 [Benniella sp.]|nr:MAG: hypothetical protein J3Q66DRAFT_366571 [Benniella sp.]